MQRSSRAYFVPKGIHYWTEEDSYNNRNAPPEVLLAFSKFGEMSIRNNFINGVVSVGNSDHKLRKSRLVQQIDSIKDNTTTSTTVNRLENLVSNNRKLMDHPAQSKGPHR